MGLFFLSACQTAPPEGCLPVKPNLEVVLFLEDTAGRVDGSWILALLDPEDPECHAVPTLTEAASGGCLIDDGRLLLYEVDAGLVATSTAPFPQKLIMLEKWTVMSTKQKPDGHRDEECVETFRNTYEAR